MTSQDDLSSWTKDRLSNLYLSNEEDFHGAFDAAFSPTAQVTVNGEVLARDKAKENIQGLRTAMSHAEVEWVDVAASAEGGDGETGKVTGSYVVTRSLKFRLRAGPMQMQRVVAFEAQVGRDEATNDGKDNRRIVQLSETVEEKHKAVSLHPSPSTKD